MPERGNGPVRRRRRRNDVADPLVKATFQLARSTIEGIRMAVESGAGASGSALVEEAVRARLREIRRSQLDEEYRRAAADPEFIKEMEEMTAAFDSALLDGLEED